MDSEKQSFKILMFPWLAHGHIFPYLELAKRILKRKNFHIYFCSTAINFSSINNFIEKNLLHNSIELVELHLPQWPELPPHYHTTKNLPQNLMPTLHIAFQASKSSFADIISTVKPDLLMYDMLQIWSPKLASSHGIPAVHFTPFAAASVSFFLRYYTSFEVDCPFPEMSFSEYEKKNLDEMMEFLSVTVCSEDQKDGYFINFKLSSDIVLIKTSMVFEKKFIDYISADSKKRLVLVGPLVLGASDTNEKEDSEIVQWLNKKNKHSTVYISFGSESFLSKEEIREIAKGVELSNVNFIWVIKFPVEENVISVKETLPPGFLDRVKDRGMIVEGWAPQANILSHSSIGGFLSHCGWSSINESVYFGVPIIGMPLKVNMFIDARMSGEAGVCLEVVRDEDGVFRGEEIGKAINKVIVEKKGEEMRRRARELSEKMRLEEEEALDETAEELWKICMKKN